MLSRQLPSTRSITCYSAQVYADWKKFCQMFGATLWVEMEGGGCLRCSGRENDRKSAVWRGALLRTVARLGAWAL